MDGSHLPRQGQGHTGTGANQAVANRLGSIQTMEAKRMEIISNEIKFLRSSGIVLSQRLMLYIADAIIHIAKKTAGVAVIFLNLSRKLQELE